MKKYLFASFYVLSLAIYPFRNINAYIGGVFCLTTISLYTTGFYGWYKDFANAIYLVSLFAIIFFLIAVSIKVKSDDKLKDKTNYKNIGIQLALFNKEARKLLEKIHLQPQNEYDCWQKKVYKYLENYLDVRYAELFFTGATMGSKIGNPPKELKNEVQIGLWKSLQTQKGHLEKFIEEFLEREIMVNNRKH